MSAAEQLTLDGRAPKAKKSPIDDMCRCGHDVREHTAKRRGCSRCGVGCKRYRARSRKPPELPKGLAAPAGSVAIMRQDTKKPKWCGWVLFDGSSLLAYLDHLETKSPNVYKKIAQGAQFGRITRERQGQLMAALANEEKAQRERAMLALETVHAEAQIGQPRKVVLTRISRGKLDGDNNQGALKHIRDGIAEGLLLDADTCFDDGTIALEYSQAAPGKEGVYGVRIEIFW